MRKTVARAKFQHVLFRAAREAHRQMMVYVVKTATAKLSIGKYYGYSFREFVSSSDDDDIDESEYEEVCRVLEKAGYDVGYLIADITDFEMSYLRMK
jgi:hypothetical protein